MFWKANKKTWVTTNLLTELFLECFIPGDKSYLDKEFEVPLLIDNVTGHRKSLKDIHPNVKVMFLPSNTSGNQTLDYDF